MYSEFCLLHRLGLWGGGGGRGRIVNFTNFGVWGKGGFFFLYQPFVGILGGGEGGGGELGGSLSKLTIFWGSIEILGICLGIVRIGVKTY